MAHTNNVGIKSESESETLIIHESKSESSEGAIVAHTNDIGIVSESETMIIHESESEFSDGGTNGFTMANHGFGLFLHCKSAFGNGSPKIYFIFTD